MRKPEYVDELYGMDALDSLLPRADVVALSLPQSPETNGLMNGERLALMKKGSILINVGRGSAVDQQALASTLNSGHLGGALTGCLTTAPGPNMECKKHIDYAPRIRRMEPSKHH